MEKRYIKRWDIYGEDIYTERRYIERRHIKAYSGSYFSILT